MSGLRTRAISAVIFVALILGGLLGGPYSFMALFSIVTALCLYEFYSMVLDRYQRRDRVRIGLGLAFGLAPHLIASAVLFDWLPNREELLFALILAFFPLLFLMFIYELFAASKHPFENVGMMVMGTVYIGAPFAMLDYIAYQSGQFDWQLVLGILLLTWLSDTGAYLAGSTLGKTKLLPRISPKKTWEGFAGGAVLVLISSYILGEYLPVIRHRDWFAIAVIVIIFGSLGDLIESMLKRSIFVKDSGKLLPGHGGLLDRFDAFIFLLPFVSAYLIFVR
ncbi:MAG: phosphatidate cytidylyltransferase [Saprospiraceae bacterium]